MAGKPLQRLKMTESRLLPGESQKPRSAVGALLRQRRMERGLGLRDVADHIRIRSNHLEAIESGRYEDLPGRTYAIGFVRSYAEWLDLDGEEIIRRFRDEAAGLGDATALVFPSPAPEGRVPGRLVLAAGVVLAVAIYGGWFALSTRDMAVADLVPEVPERLSQWLADRRAGGAVAMQGAGASPSDVPSQAAPAQPAERASDEPRVPPAAATLSAIEPTRPPVQAVLVVPPPAPQSSIPVSSGPASSTPSEPAVVAPAATERPSAPVAEARSVASEVTTRTEVTPATPPAAVAVLPAPTTQVVAASAEPVSQIEDDDEETATPPPETTAAPATSDNVAAAPAPRFPAATDLAEPRAEQQGREIAVRPPAVAALPPAATQLPASPALPSATATPDASGARIVIRATDESWVQVRDADRNPIMTRVLLRGDVYRVPNRPGLTLQSGNAGALEILVDGQPVPAIGPVGSVRRDVLLEPDRLRAGAVFTTDR